MATQYNKSGVAEFGYEFACGGAADGRVILTGAEGREVERQEKEVERLRAERLAERLRAMGVNPDEV